MPSSTRFARLVKRGDVLNVSMPGVELPIEDVVRGVDMIIHMGNGVDHVVPANSYVEVVIDEDFTEEVKAQLERMQSEIPAP